MKTTEITSVQISALRKELTKTWPTTTSEERKQRPGGCPTYTYKLRSELRENFTKQEIQGEIITNACK